jgi:hypothetical protein
MRRPAYALLFVAALSLVGGLAACGKPSTPNGAANTDTIGSDSTPVLGGAPSSSPSTVASTSPSPGGGGGGGTSDPPPHSTIANKAGYTWVYQAAASYPSATPYQYNSAGGAISINHTGTGRYIVTFGGLADTGGVAQAQAYGSTSDYCTVDSWYPAGANQNVAVSCFTASGQYDDSRFVVSFAVGSQGSARFSYLWAEQATNTATYHPSASYRYDAVNSGAITVHRVSTGQYQVYLPAAGPELSDPWTIQVTAYGSRFLCKLASFTVSTRKAVVACRDANGFLADTKFSLSFASESSLLGRGDRRYGEGSSASDGVQNPSSGVYVVRLQQLGADLGQVVAIASGSASTYCHVGSWGSAGADLDVHVNCYNPGGALASSQFLVAATW